MLAVDNGLNHSRSGERGGGGGRVGMGGELFMRERMSAGDSWPNVVVVFVVVGEGEETE